MTTDEETNKEDEEDEEDVEDEEDRMGGRNDLDSWLEDVGHFNCFSVHTMLFDIKLPTQPRNTQVI